MSTLEPSGASRASEQTSGAALGEALSDQLSDMAAELARLRSRVSQLEQPKEKESETTRTNESLMEQITVRLRPLVSEIVDEHWKRLEHSFEQVADRIERVSRETALENLDSAKEMLRAELQAYMESMAIHGLTRESSHQQEKTKLVVTSESRLEDLRVILDAHPSETAEEHAALQDALGIMEKDGDGADGGKRLASLLQSVQTTVVSKIFRWLFDSRSSTARVISLTFLAEREAIEEELLLHGIADADPGVRQATLKAAFLQGGSKHEELFCRGLLDPSATVRISALRYMAWFPSEISRRAVACALRDENANVRRAAMDAVASGGREVEHLLAPLLKDNDPMVQHRARTILKEDHSGYNAQAIETDGQPDA